MVTEKETETGVEAGAEGEDVVTVVVGGDGAEENWWYHREYSHKDHLQLSGQVIFNIT